MNRKLTQTITAEYFQAWLTQDLALFLSVLKDDIIIKECYGPVYQGKAAAEQWFRAWNDGRNRVLQWPIESFLYDTEAETAAAEWYFQCLYEGKVSEFYGSSVITFQAEAIAGLNEYEMKKEQYYPYN